MMDEGEPVLSEYIPNVSLLALPNPDFYGMQKNATIRLPPILFNPIYSPKPKEVVMVESFYESCSFRAVLGTVGGFGFGIFLGLLLQSTDPSLMPQQAQELSVKQIAKESAQNALRMGKSMALVGGMLMCSECMLEETRAKSDRWNPILGGCIAGGIMGFRFGVKSAIAQCLYFSAFSAAIDAFQNRH